MRLHIAFIYKQPVGHPKQMNSKPPIRAETLLSTYIIIWSYTYLIVRYCVANKSNEFESILSWCNPAFAMGIAFLWQILAGIMIVLRFDSQVPRIMLKYAVSSTILKTAPLWLLLRRPVPWMKSAISFFVLYACYIFYIQYERMNLFDIYDDIMDSFVSDDNRVPPYKWTIDLLNKINPR